jgi:CTP synthase (UTP-ammonia lyase)
MVSVGIVGDYRATNETHLATTASIGHCAKAAGLVIDVSWVPTTAVASGQESALSGFNALLIAPGSPYESIDGALEAIRVARTRGVPLLGTCGGFQHVVLEFARNVLGLVDADHAEYDPYASTLFITPLSCSLAGQQMHVELRPETLAARTYGSLTANERYYCNFGLNPEHLPALVSGGLVVSGEDQNGEARVMELPGHRFFVATLFVPQTSNTADRPHPLVSAFVRAAAGADAIGPATALP